MNEAVYQAMKDGRATYIGEGEWVKGVAYQVYKFQEKFYSIIVEDGMLTYISNLKEIKQSEINDYI